MPGNSGRGSLLGSGSLLGKRPHGKDNDQGSKVPRSHQPLQCPAPGCIENQEQLNILKTLTAESYINQSIRLTELQKEVEALKKDNRDLNIKLNKEEKKVEKLERAIVEYLCPSCHIFYAPPERAPLLLICTDQICSSCLPKQEHTDVSVKCPVCEDFIPKNTERVNWPLVQLLRRLYFSLSRPHRSITKS